MTMVMTRKGGSWRRYQRESVPIYLTDDFIFGRLPEEEQLVVRVRVYEILRLFAFVANAWDTSLMFWTMLLSHS